MRSPRKHFKQYCTQSRPKSQEHFARDSRLAGKSVVWPAVRCTQGCRPPSECENPGLLALSCERLGALACAILVRFKAQDHTIESGCLVSAFGTAMFSAIMIATTLGLFFPFLLRRIGIDPAISSGPLVSTANDSISMAIYMTLALLLAR